MFGLLLNVKIIDYLKIPMAMINIWTFCQFIIDFVNFFLCNNH